MKGNEEETERRGRVTGRQPLAGLYFLLFLQPRLSSSALIMTLRFISDLNELATVSLSLQQTEN